MGSQNTKQPSEENRDRSSSKQNRPKTETEKGNSPAPKEKKKKKLEAPVTHPLPNENPNIIPTTKTDFLAIHRPAINQSAQLGSLYNAIEDCFPHESTIQLKDKHKSTETPKKKFRWFIDNQYTNIFDYLRDMNFDEAILQSLLVRMIEPSLGISALVNYGQPIDNKTLFFYYPYEHQRQKCSTSPKDYRSVQIATTNVTHMVTEIISGFEILCVIRVHDDQSAQTIKSFLQQIVQRLIKTGENFLTDR